jgi:hypothetical protein
MHLFAEPTFCDNDWIERSLDLLREMVEWQKRGFLSEFDYDGTSWRQLVPVYETRTANDYEWVDAEVVRV